MKYEAKLDVRTGHFTLFKDGAYRETVRRMTYEQAKKFLTQSGYKLIKGTDDWNVTTETWGRK